MTPVAQLIGKWIAKVDGEIVARADTMDEVVQAAVDAGYEDFSVEKVAEPGGYIL